MSPYWEVTTTWAEVAPKSTLIVTEVPWTQNVGAVPTEDRGALRTNEVSPPCGRLKVLVSNVRGLLAPGSPAGPPTVQIAGPPDEMLQGAAQAGGVIVPVLVPA